MSIGQASTVHDSPYSAQVQLEKLCYFAACACYLEVTRKPTGLRKCRKTLPAEITVFKRWRPSPSLLNQMSREKCDAREVATREREREREFTSVLIRKSRMRQENVRAAAPFCMFEKKGGGASQILAQCQPDFKKWSSLGNCGFEVSLGMGNLVIWCKIIDGSKKARKGRS
jgi:hypothetical protein